MFTAIYGKVLVRYLADEWTALSLRGIADCDEWLVVATTVDELLQKRLSFWYWLKQFAVDALLQDIRSWLYPLSTILDLPARITVAFCGSMPKSGSPEPVAIDFPSPALLSPVLARIASRP
jgi:hypothetical protein